MSRNFELLTQLDPEVELDSKDPRPRVSVHPSIAKEVVPMLAGHAGDARGEEMLRLVQRVFLSSNGSAPRQIVICGVDGENGSSSICANAGQTLAANSSRQVCLIDANVRSPRLSRMFGVDKMTPFSTNKVSAREHCLQIEENLWLAGPSLLADNNRVLLPVHDLKERLAQLREVFEYVLIDAPGTSVCGDAQLLGQVTDAAILVIEANSTRRLTARNAKQALDAAGVRLLGTILHDRWFPIPKRLYCRL
jgi:Mrp family chromosome partitioning ATPase